MACILLCILFGDRETRRQEGAAYKIRSCTLSCTIFLVCRRGALSAIGGPTGPVGPWKATGSRTAALQQLPSRREARRTNHHCDCEPSSHYHAIATSAVALAGLPNNLRARYGAGLVLLSMAADVSTPGGGAYGRRSQTHGMIVSPGLAAVQDQASSGINEPSN